MCLYANSGITIYKLQAHALDSATSVVAKKG